MSTTVWNEIRISSCRLKIDFCFYIFIVLHFKKKKYETNDHFLFFPQEKVKPFSTTFCFFFFFYKYLSVFSLAFLILDFLFSFINWGMFCVDVVVYFDWWWWWWWHCFLFSHIFIVVGWLCLMELCCVCGEKQVT